jgi:hypothetical protein
VRGARGGCIVADADSNQIRDQGGGTAKLLGDGKEIGGGNVEIEIGARGGDRIGGDGGASGDFLQEIADDNLESALTDGARFEVVGAGGGEGAMVAGLTEEEEDEGAEEDDEGEDDDEGGTAAGRGFPWKRGVEVHVIQRRA